MMRSLSYRQGEGAELFFVWCVFRCFVCFLVGPITHSAPLNRKRALNDDKSVVFAALFLDYFVLDRRLKERLLADACGF
jgi:hypothetical protein